MRGSSALATFLAMMAEVARTISRKAISLESTERLTQMPVKFQFAQPTTYRNLVGALQIIMLVVATITSGCISPRRASNVAPEVIDVPVRFIGVSGSAMPEDERPDKWVAVLGVVPGGIFGAARFRPPPEEAYGNASTVPINLSEIQIGLSRQSATISSAAAAGWKIEPAETRFTRLATTIVSSDTDRGPFLIGFRDSVSKKSLVLVFFDRPCRLTGTAENQGPSGEIVENRIDVTVKKAGLNWLEATEKGTTTYITNATAVAPSKLIFVVEPPKR